jgi:hypothetical protein
MHHIVWSMNEIFAYEKFVILVRERKGGNDSYYQYKKKPLKMFQLDV